MSSEDHTELGRLPLGLLLGRISSALRDNLLQRCPDVDDDVRVIGLALAIEYSPGAAQADYARFLGIDLNTASRLIGRAEETGILCKLPSSQDRRAHVLVLTEKGMGIAERGRAAVDEVQAGLASQIGAREMSDFRRIAEQIVLTFPK